MSNIWTYFFSFLANFKELCSYLLGETKMNEICNSFIKRSYERLACQLMKILCRLYTTFLTGFSLFLKQILLNCWVRAWIFAFFPPSFTSTTSELSWNVFILNSKDFLSHEICWFWSRNSCLCMDAVCPHFFTSARDIPVLCRKTKAVRCTHCAKTATSS